MEMKTRSEICWGRSSPQLAMPRIALEHVLNSKKILSMAYKYDEKLFLLEDKELVK